MVGNPVKELNIPKTLVPRERGHVTTAKFRETCLELINAKLKYFKREVKQALRISAFISLLFQIV